MTAQDWFDFSILMLLVAPIVGLCGWLAFKAWKPSKTERIPSLEAKKWGFLIPILIVVAGHLLFAYLLAPIWFGLLYDVWFADTSATIIAWVKLPYVNFALSLAVTAMQLSLLFWYVSYRGSSLRSLGLNRPKPRYLVNGLLAYGIYFLIYFGIFALIYTFIPAIDINQQQELGFGTVSGFGLVMALITLVILPPIAEEILMRGFLYHSLKQQLPHVWAVIVTSILFAAAHLQLGAGGPPLWIAAVDTFLLSLVLIKVTDYSKSLWPAIIVHMVKNGVAFVSLFILS